MAASSDQKMPMFDPKSMTFAQYIDDVFEIKSWGFDWDANKKLKQLALILPTGWCTKVFRDIHSDNKKSYDLLKAALIKEIDRTDEKRQTAASDFHKITQKPGESIDDYGHRIYRKCEEAYPNFAKGNRSELCAHRFVEGIYNPKLKDQLQLVICQEPKMPKFDNLIDVARRLADTDTQSSKPSSNMFHLRCNYCHRVGHFAKKCHKRQRDQQDKQDKRKPDDWVKSAKCYSCSRRGHLAKNCPNKDYRGPQRNGKVNEVHDSSSNDAYPTKSVKIGQLVTNAVIDSGASVSCISYTMLCEAFPHGFDLTDTTAVLTGPSSLPLKTSGVVKTYICFDDNVVPCSLHVLDVDNDTFLIGWDVMCNFDQVTLKPQENSVEFGSVIEQNSESVMNVRLMENSVIPPLSQRVLRVAVDCSSSSSVLIERLSEFEEKSGLLLGRTVSSTENPRIIVMNPDTYSKSVYKAQTVGLATEVKDHMSTLDDSNIDQTECNVNHVSCENSVKPSWNIGQLDEEPKSKLLNLLSRYKEDVFTGLGCARQYPYELKLKKNADLSKVRSRRYRFNPKMSAEIESQVQSMLQSGVIEHSKTDILSPIVLARKRDGTQRFCLDFRSLNTELQDETFPLMTPQEAMMHLKNSKFFSVIDMCSAFNQIPLTEDSRRLTGFQTSSGVYQFQRLCFGLKVAPLAFQRVMHHVIGSLGFEHVLIYLDDCLIHTSTLEEHLQTLEKVFDCFTSAGLTLRTEKCHFFMESVNYLGFKLSEKGIQPGDKGLTAIRDYPIPRTWEEVRSFLGLCTYFMCFIPNYSDIALPLSKLVESKRYIWNSSTESAFQVLRQCLMSSPVLKHPDFSDTANILIVQTDASDTGLAGVLLQADDHGLEHAITYASKKLTKTERNYSTIHREALAII